MAIRMHLAFVTLAVLVFTTGTVLAEHSSTTSAAETSQQQPQQNAFDIGNKYSEIKEIHVPSYLNHLLTGEYTKRASMRGFQGMRGKKNDDQFEEDYYYDKRAPMGFQGMRGKKAQFNDADIDDDDDDDYGKRAPMGFQGMRGKKNLEQVIDELEKRAMLGFQGMRGKKAEEYEEDIPELSPYYDDSDDWHKRAPMGFQGMRGRKNYPDDMDKRALLGFHGMRGKKGMYEQEEMMPLVDSYMDKRPMMMGFHGMRGKRSANYYEAEGFGRYMDKRSPYRFFGSRGKKNPRWELRGKFVGVRGKKWSQPPPRLDILAKQLASSYDAPDDTLALGIRQ